MLMAVVAISYQEPLKNFRDYLNVTLTMASE